MIILDNKLVSFETNSYCITISGGTEFSLGCSKRKGVLPDGALDYLLGKLEKDLGSNGASDGSSTVHVGEPFLCQPRSRCFINVQGHPSIRDVLADVAQPEIYHLENGCSRELVLW
jgi:hypothetical protein